MIARREEQMVKTKEKNYYAVLHRTLSSSCSVRLWEPETLCQPLCDIRKKNQTARTSCQFAVMRLAYAPPYIATSGLRGPLNCNVIYDVNSLSNGIFLKQTVDIQGADRLMEMADG